MRDVTMADIASILMEDMAKLLKEYNPIPKFNPPKKPDVKFEIKWRD